MPDESEHKPREIDQMLMLADPKLYDGPIGKGFVVSVPDEYDWGDGRNSIVYHHFVVVDAKGKKLERAKHFTVTDTRKKVIPAPKRTGRGD